MIRGARDALAELGDDELRVVFALPSERDYVAFRAELGRAA